MPKKSAFDTERLRHVLQAQYQVITRTQALLCGLPPSTLDRYIAPGGSWQRLLPGVYLAVTGAATQDQREMAALLYAGPRSLITGSAAVRRHRLRPAGPDVVDVLIPWQRRRQSAGFVRVHRTRRLPERLYVTGKIRFTKAPRAVADAARSLTRFDDVRHVVCDAVQRRACTVAELTEELEAGPAAGSALFREALAEIGDGVRSVAEAARPGSVCASWGSAAVVGAAQGSCARASAGTRAGSGAAQGVTGSCGRSGRLLISKTNYKTLGLFLVT